MDMKTQIGKSERFGRWLGRGWRGYARRERRASAWLVARGAPAVAATALLRIIKLTVMGVLLYAAFWLTLLLLLAVAAVWVIEKRLSDEEDEWPFSDLNELRKSPGYDPNLYNDTSHELYEDD